MKPLVIVGILLIVVGVIGLAYGGISYTKEKTVVDLGPIKATADTRETIPVPPILGGIALVGGIVLLVTGGKK
jgi:uncharacterized membrane protein YidH (DUF202 family)